MDMASKTHQSKLGQVAPKNDDWPHFRMDISFFDSEVRPMHKGVEVSMSGEG